MNLLEEIAEDEESELAALRVINGNIIRLGRMVSELGGQMATAAQVQALEEKTAMLEQAESVTETEIRAVIDELKAHQADQPDPALDDIAARLDALTSKQTQLASDEASDPPTTGEPVTPPADTTGTSADTSGTASAPPPADDPNTTPSA